MSLKMNLWKVRVKHPPGTPGNGQAWPTNRKYNVLASTPETACDQVRNQYPGVEIQSVSTLGQVDFLGY